LSFTLLLTLLCQFPTVNEHYDGNFTAALRQLAQPVKLKLQAMSPASPQEGVVGVVGIESLAPLHIVDNFIYERLNPSAAHGGPSSAAAAKSHKFNLYLDGAPLEHSMPILRAITTSSTPASFPMRTMSGSGGSSGGASSHPYDAQHPMWSRVHTIHFEPRPDAPESAGGAALAESRRLAFLDYESSMSSACSVECSPDIAGLPPKCSFFFLLPPGVSVLSVSRLLFQARCLCSKRYTKFHSCFLRCAAMPTPSAQGLQPRPCPAPALSCRCCATSNSFAKSCVLKSCARYQIPSSFAAETSRNGFLA
jgi:hypothetical protein